MAAAATRSTVLSLSGLWSNDSGIAAPPRESTQRESPAFAQKRRLSLVTNSVTAVHPERSLAWSGSVPAERRTPGRERQNFFF